MPFHADRIAGVLLMLSLACVCGRPSIVYLTQVVLLARATRPSPINLSAVFNLFRFWSGFRPPACGTIYYHSVRHGCVSTRSCEITAGSKDRFS
jgi:hypothetical protein